MTACVITGASGIAAATARLMAARGWLVFVIGVDPRQCAALAAELGDGCAGWAGADLREEGQAVDAFARAWEACPDASAVIAVAGGSGRRFGDGPLHELSLPAWEETLRLNLTTTFLTAREALRRLRERGGGSLTLTTSVLASAPAPRHFTTHAYAAAKAAIAGLTTSLAAAYARDGVRVNAVAPGLVRTPMAQRAAGDEDILAFAARKQPIARGLLTPDQVADVMCWLAETTSVTGQVVAADAGWSVTAVS